VVVVKGPIVVEVVVLELGELVEGGDRACDIYEIYALDM